MVFGIGSAHLSNPPGASPVMGAVQWLEGTLLGTIATTVAIVAVASVGLGMLTGRVDLKRGVTIVTGCFILFGASSIAAGLQRAVSGTSIAEVGVAAVDPSPPVVIPPRKQPADPYAGASLLRN